MPKIILVIKNETSIYVNDLTKVIFKVEETGAKSEYSLAVSESGTAEEKIKNNIETHRLVVYEGQNSYYTLYTGIEEDCIEKLKKIFNSLNTYDKEDNDNSFIKIVINLC